MSKKIIIVVCLFAILVVVLAYVILSSPSSTVLSVEPKIVQETTGQNFTVNVSISNVADLYAWQLELSWNPSLLNVTNVAEGPMLKSSGNSTFFSPVVNNAAGNISALCTRVLSFGSNVTGVNGYGTLMTVQFEVIGSGACELNLYNTSLRDSNDNAIAHMVQNGQFSS
jgi:general secretion pathway protein D